MAFLFLLSAVLGRPYSGQVRRVRFVAWAFSLLALVGLGCLWYLATSATRDTPDVGTALLNQGDVEAYLADHRATLPSGRGERPVLLPTAVFVQSVELTGTNNVDVTGYVWQTYDETVPAEIGRGFVLPEALEEAYEADEVFRFRKDGGEVIGWYFQATLRQPFDYGRYPFDHHDVWLRLWHRDLDGRAILVPDFVSYSTMDPATLPGVDEQIVFEGWEAEFSAFSYVDHRYTTSFGQGPEAAPRETPELYFNVGLQRGFAGPMVAVLLLLFVCLTLTTREPERLRRTGFDTSAALACCAALLFVAFFDHRRIQDAIPRGQVAYLENVWFVLYAAIIGVAVNAALLARGNGVTLVTYKDNALPKLLYWPLVSALLLIVTVVSLYA